MFPSWPPQRLPGLVGAQRQIAATRLASFRLRLVAAILPRQALAFCEPSAPSGLPASLSVRSRHLVGTIPPQIENGQRQQTISATAVEVAIHRTHFCIEPIAIV